MQLKVGQAFLDTYGTRITILAVDAWSIESRWQTKSRDSVWTDEIHHIESSLPSWTLIKGLRKKLTLSRSHG